MQLKWQVAASSCYDKWAEMRPVTGSGASTAAESLSLERTRSTSGGLNCVYPRLGTWFPCYLICKSTEKFDLRNNEVSQSSVRCQSLLSCFDVTWSQAAPCWAVVLCCVPFVLGNQDFWDPHDIKHPWHQKRNFTFVNVKSGRTCTWNNDLPPQQQQLAVLAVNSWKRATL